VCKHAVAVVLAAAEYVKQKKEIPLLTEDNDLFQALFDDSGDDDGDDDDEWLEEDDEPVIKARPAEGKGKARLKKIFEGLGKEELVTLLMDLAYRFPEIERGVLEKEQLSKGKADKIVSALKREIRELTSQPAWRDHWKGASNLPDYSHVLEQLQALLDNGHSDQVIQLGDPALLSIFLLSLQTKYAPPTTSRLRGLYQFSSSLAHHHLTHTIKYLRTNPPPLACQRITSIATADLTENGGRSYRLVFACHAVNSAGRRRNLAIFPSCRPFSSVYTKLTKRCRSASGIPRDIRQGAQD
jgi:hypothetical protein